MSHSARNGCISYFIFSESDVFDSKDSCFGIPMEQDSIENHLTIPFVSRTIGDKVLLIYFQRGQIGFFNLKAFLNSRIQGMSYPLKSPHSSAMNFLTLNVTILEPITLRDASLYFNRPLLNPKENLTGVLFEAEEVKKNLFP